MDDPIRRIRELEERIGRLESVAERHLEILKGFKVIAQGHHKMIEHALAGKSELRPALVKLKKLIH